MLPMPALAPIGTPTQKQAIVAKLKEFLSNVITQGPSFFAEGAGWTLAVILADLISLDTDVLAYVLKSVAAGIGAAALSGIANLILHPAKRCFGAPQNFKRGAADLAPGLIGSAVANGFWQRGYDMMCGLTSFWGLRATGVGLISGIVFYLSSLLMKVLISLCTRVKVASAIKDKLGDDGLATLCAIVSAALFIFTYEGPMATSTSYSTLPTDADAAISDISFSGLLTGASYLGIESLRFLLVCAITLIKNKIAQLREEKAGLLGNPHSHHHDSDSSGSNDAAATAIRSDGYGSLA